MKIRNGFVSNSSSSSFCIYGICAEESEIKEALVAKGATKDELEDDLYEYFDNWSYNRKKREGELTAADISEYEDKFFKPEDGFEMHNPYEYDGEIYLGVEWSSIGNDETGAEFKARIDAKLKDLFGKDVTCSTHSEAWRDG